MKYRITKYWKDKLEDQALSFQAIKFKKITPKACLGFDKEGNEQMFPLKSLEFEAQSTFGDACYTSLLSQGVEDYTWVKQDLWGLSNENEETKPLWFFNLKETTIKSLENGIEMLFSA